MKKDNSRHFISYKILGKNIRKQRELQNLSQEDLAELISSARNYVGCIERGEKFPSLTVIFGIAAVLKCIPKDLFN